MGRDQIISLLPKLSAHDRQQVMAALKLLGTKDDAGAMVLGAQTDWLLEGICVLLRERGLGKVTQASLRSRSTAIKPYNNKLGQVLAFLAEVEETNGLGKRERPALALTCARTLADWLAARNMLSDTTMLSMVDHIPEALDAAYPGYVKGGLFGAVLKGL